MGTVEFKGYKIMQTTTELDVVLVQEAGETGYTGWFKDFPGVVSQGDTMEEVKEGLNKALVVMFNWMKDDCK